MKWDFTMTQHIFLTGKKHIGKSTLIQKILDDYKKTSDGFLTVRTKNYLKDQYSVHMYQGSWNYLTESLRISDSVMSK